MPPYWGAACAGFPPGGFPGMPPPGMYGMPGAYPQPGSLANIFANHQPVQPAAAEPPAAQQPAQQPVQQPRASRRAAVPAAGPNVQHVRHSAVSGKDEKVAGGRRAQRSAPSSQFANPQSRRAVNERAAAYPSAPHTADGSALTESNDKPSGGGGHQTAPHSHAGRGLGYKPYAGKVNNDIGALGMLKPDLNADELVQKRANLERIKMFSRNLRVINREEEAQIIAAKKERETAAPPTTSPKELSKREKAKEYARRVPKPRLRPADEEARQLETEMVTEVEEDELDALALLEKQHAEHKAAAARIREELGL